jgi:hypothetical protein
MAVLVATLLHVLRRIHRFGQLRRKTILLNHALLM